MDVKRKVTCLISSDRFNLGERPRLIRYEWLAPYSSEDISSTLGNMRSTG